jgi:hypothetical protein
MKPVIPVSLRKWEQRVAANAVANAILRADVRKQRTAAKKPQSIKKAAPTVMADPQRLHLSDLKRAFAERERLQRTEQRRFPMHQGQGPKEY